jgi:hypothetical protein
MKYAILSLVGLLALLSCNGAMAEEARGYLVIEVSRLTYSGNHKKDLGIKQSFKISLTKEFMANFKHLPNPNSQGTGFCCSAGSLKINNGGTLFTWWIRRGNPNDSHWHINMWGEGVETVKRAKIESLSHTATIDLKIKNWDDIDMRYLVSYLNGYDGINVSFTARYVSAEDHKTLDAIPAAPVQKADRSVLFKGDDLSRLHFETSCSFQEG